jgi:hypothetical protein
MPNDLQGLRWWHVVLALVGLVALVVGLLYCGFTLTEKLWGGMW